MLEMREKANDIATDCKDKLRHDVATKHIDVDSAALKPVTPACVCKSANLLPPLVSRLTVHAGLRNAFWPCLASSLSKEWMTCKLSN